MQLHGVEIGIAASAMVLGALVLVAARPWLWLSMVLIGVLAVFHGHAHVIEVPAQQGALQYALGLVVTTGLLHATGMVVGLLGQLPARPLALQTTGGATAMAGAYFLYGAVA